MNNDYQTYRIGFIDTAFTLLYNNEDALTILDLLFADFEKLPGIETTRDYRITSQRENGEEQLTLHEKEGEEEREIYRGTSRYELAYDLINEIIFHAVNKKKEHHALHAGAVWRGECAIVLPANSGCGKSTLTAWLVANGFHYLTDELVLLSNDGTITPFIRPISFKVGIEELKKILEKTKAVQSGNLEKIAESDIITSDTGTMLSHRLLNPDFSKEKKKVTDIIFPKYKKGTALDFKEITAAKGALYLMQSHVNARNLKGHGVGDMSNIVRNCRIWSLNYGSFADIEAIFNQQKEFFG